MAEDFIQSKALERCGDDAGLLRDLIDIFESEVVGWMRDLEQAIHERNATLVKRLAHTIKGGVSTFGDKDDHGPTWHAAREINRPRLVGPEPFSPAWRPRLTTSSSRLLVRTDRPGWGSPRPTAARRAIRSFVLLSVSLCIFAQMT